MASLRNASRQAGAFLDQETVDELLSSCVERQRQRHRGNKMFQGGEGGKVKE